MRRLTTWVGLGCGLALLLIFYRDALFRGGQLAFRDSAHYYYPLYQKVQWEWEAGRLPLWDPSENAGMPLLGNPTAAVLYPGKLIYAALPYAWGARLYAVAHSALAFAGMLALMRSWGTSRAGSSLAALAYAFGGPVIFQYCNIIFLVGAAWCPWGLLAVDQWLRLGKFWALPALAVVLAMQVLGGDPESAYLIGLCAGGYAVGLAWVARRGPWRPTARFWVLAGVGVLGWMALTVAAGAIAPGFRPEDREPPWGPFARWIESGRLPSFRKSAFDGPVPGLPISSALHQVAVGAWALAGLGLLIRWRRGGSARVPLVPKLAGLAAAAVLAGALSAVQMVPVLEFTSQSGRASEEGAHDPFPFSLEPYRAAEAVWPGVFGRRFGLPVIWRDLIAPTLNHRVWVPSLYLGASTLVLALAAAGFRHGPPGRAWLTGIAAVSLVGSFGEFAGPLTLARYVPALRESIGPHDGRNTNAVRLDGYLRDGDGSPYALMADLLPGFQQFRFPSKLLTLTSLAVAGLAGLGWDRETSGSRRSRRAVRLAAVGAGGSAALLAGAWAARGWIASSFDATKLATLFGPLDGGLAAVDIQVALLQGGLALGATAGVLVLARKRLELAGALAVLALAVDLALGNEMLVKSVPQSVMEAVPKVVKLIAEAEKLDPATGPYRVHRMPIWNPTSWQERASDDRSLDFVRWESATIQPKYGILHGIEYTTTLGVAELYDHSWFFSPFPRALRPEAARMLRQKVGETIVVYPRRGFDLWNSRYFVLPAAPAWNDADRAIASFLPRTKSIYPDAEFLKRPPGDPEVDRWLRTEDVQVLRNLDEYPRAWVVHEARFKPPVSGLTRKARRETMEEILFSDDPFWKEPVLTLFDPRRMAWLEVDDPSSLAGYLAKIPPQAGESARVVTEEASPTRTVLEVSLARPGLVILGDVFYPGWTLTIDGQPAPILRANRLMRGAAVKAGKHRLVYTYAPGSLRVGASISLLGLLGLARATVWSLRRKGSVPA